MQMQMQMQPNANEFELRFGIFMDMVGWLVSVYAFFVPFYSCLFCFFWFLLFDAKSHAIELGLCILLCAMLLLSKTKDLIQHTNSTISFNTLCDILFVWAIQVFGWILVLMLWF